METDELKAIKVQDALAGVPAVYVGDLIRINVGLLKVWACKEDNESEEVQLVEIIRGPDNVITLRAKWPTK